MFKAISSSSLFARYPDVTFGDDVSIGEDVEIGVGSQISHGVRIYPGTRLGSEVTVLENTVIGRPTLLPPGSDLVKRKLADKVPGTVIGDGTVIGASVVIYRAVMLGLRNIICDLSSIREYCAFGDDILIGRGVMVQIKTKIGNRTKIMDSCHLPGDMEIESDVFMSAQVSGASENSLGRSEKLGSWSGPYICKGAYIGVGAILLPGIRVGAHSVVAAGALASKDVPDGALVMGLPARIVREIGKRV